MRKLIIVLPVVFLLLVLYACSSLHRNESHADVPLSSIKKGKELAARYCGNCHALPDPSLLDARTWEEGVLPQMGPRLGILAYDFRVYPTAKADSSLPPHYYPDTPLISYVDWEHIMNYYTATSPDSLEVKTKQPAEDLELFTVETPAYKSSFPLVSYTGINETRKELLVFDMNTRHLLSFDPTLRLKDSLKVQGAISDVLADSNKLAWLNMGNINPANSSLGFLQQVTYSQGQLSTGEPAVAFSNLQRPVTLQRADINADGRPDYIVGSFGFMTGHLSWYEAGADGSFSQHLIKPSPGAAQVYVTDDNKDGLPDLWVLFAQGDESIRRFINKGGGRFEEQLVLRFPAIYGSTSFELVDMDNDGDQDIVYTCGDNADYSQVLKPYHGVYVFLQDKKGQFQERYFYPMNGAFKSRTMDFDGDGAADIAAIAYFADYRNETGFVLLQHKGDLRFRPATVPQARSGRWITLDAGDLDGDGHPDLVLGNLARGPMIVPATVNWQQGPLFLLLRNKGKK